MSEPQVWPADYCMDCTAYIALQNGACPKCGGKNIMQYNFVAAAKVKPAPFITPGAENASVSISSAGATSGMKNYDNADLLTAKLWQTYLMAKPQADITAIDVKNMLELANFADFIIGEIKTELQKGGCK